MIDQQYFSIIRGKWGKFRNGHYKRYWSKYVDSWSKYVDSSVLEYNIEEKIRECHVT